MARRFTRAPSSGEVIDMASWKVIATLEDEPRMLKFCLTKANRSMKGRAL